MTLKEIGWNRHFSREFKKVNGENLFPARVFSEQKKSYLLFSKKGEIRASARGVLWHKKTARGETPVVGDWVTVQILPEKDSALINSILPRKSSFSRRTAGGRKKYGGGKLSEQIIAANIDVALLVVGLDGEYNLRRVERYMALVQSSGALAMIILNKADLCKDKRSVKKEILKIYPDIPVITMVALKKKDVGILNGLIKPGQTAALLGSSGVGKSTIINQLIGYDRQKVTEVSKHAGKGQHTTSRRELIILPKGWLIMDNPGMREIQLWADEDDLFDAFTDIEKLARDCKFRDCQHETEPGCAVRQALKKGRLNEARLQNYQKMKLELFQLSKKLKKSK